MSWLIGIVSLAILAGLVLWFLVPQPLARCMIRARRRAGGLRTRGARIEGQQWHWLESGPAGEDPLVLLHGFGADADHWTGVAPGLAPRFRLLAPDLPGWGKSGPPTDPDWSMDAQARRLAQWLDHLGIARLRLGGNSMGGYVAVAFARLYPERVRSLWLLAPGGVRDVPHSELFREIEAGRHNPLIVRHRADFHRLLDFCFVRPPWLPFPLLQSLVAGARARLEMAEPAFNGMRHDSPPLEDMARGIRAPTLIVWGEKDRVLNPDGGKRLQSCIPDSRLVMLEGCGHLPMLERPVATTRQWLEFVNHSE